MKASKLDSVVSVQISEVVLNFVEGENEGVEIRVGNKLPRTLTIGRSEECDIFLGEKKISRKHCQIIVNPNKVFLKDLQSTNGTFVNKNKVTGECDLKSNDKIQVGTTVIKITIEETKEISAPAHTQSTLAEEDVASTVAAIEDVHEDDIFSGEVSKIPEAIAKAERSVPGKKLSEASEHDLDQLAKNSENEDEPIFPPLVVEQTKSKPEKALSDLPSKKETTAERKTIKGTAPVSPISALLDDDEEVIETLPRRKEPESQRPLAGSLSAMGLADLLQSFYQNNKSGVLNINSTKRGKILVYKGDVIDASVEKVEGIKALYRMLTWNDGDFELAPLPENFKKDKIKNPITGKIESILMEGFRQYDEYQKLKSRLPAEDADLKLKPTLTAPLAKLHPKVLEVLQVVWNEKNFRKILDASSFSDLETAKMVYYLLKKEYLVVNEDS